MPIRYVTSDPDATCLSSPSKNLSFMDRQMERLQNKNIDIVLFLVEKGKSVEVAPNIHKYLFGQFFNPELTADVPSAFYIYYDEFFNRIIPMANNSSPDTELEFSFYRPKSWLPFDFAEVIVVFIALFCIIVGSLWGAASSQITPMQPAPSDISINTHEDVSAEEGALTDASAANLSTKSSQSITFSQQFIGVAMAVVMIVGILLVCFFVKNT